MSDTRQKWQAVVTWVEANMPLVRIVADPYRRYMPADQDDLKHEAVIAAFEALEAMQRRGEAPARFGAYFRTNFRNRCIRMAAGGRLANHFVIDRLAQTTHAPDNIREQSADVIEKALAVLDQRLPVKARRRRTVCYWILLQPLPVSLADVESQFSISERYARQIIEQTILNLSREAA